jgi:hypothetical protein
VVQVQNPFALTRLACLHQGAGLTGLITRDAEMMRHLKTGAPDHAAIRAELAPVRGVGCQNAVLRVKQNMGLWQALQKRHQFGQGFHGTSLRQMTASLTYLADL